MDKLEFDSKSPDGGTDLDELKRSQRREFIARAKASLAISDLAEAETLCIAALSDGPDEELLLLLATVFINAGRLEHSLQVLADVLEINPTSIEGLDWLASVLLRVGNPAEATKAARYLISLKRDSASAYNTLGQCALVQGAFSDAVQCFGRAISIEPGNAVYYHYQGLALIELNREREAISSLRRASELAPEMAAPCTALGSFLLSKGRVVEGLDVLRRGVESATSAQTLTHLAKALIEAQKFDEAVQVLNRALSLDPQDNLALDLLGVRLQEEGRFEEAIEIYERSRVVNPNSIWPVYGITRCRKMTLVDHPIIETLERMVEDDHRPQDDLRYAHYALGKVHDDLGHFDRAIAHFDEANRLSKLLRPTDQPQVADLTDSEKGRIVEVLTKEFFIAHAKAAVSSELPLLVVGMIRSGTTLVEQILTSHPEIESGGELTYWIDAPARDLLRNALRGSWSDSKATELADEYRRMLRSIGPRAKRVVDKMPINYPCLGLIHGLFPNARIIHCRRNPVATCLSIYMNFFGYGPTFAYDREAIVAAYFDYLRIMEHWRRVLPADRFLEVDYERLVKNPEDVSRQMIEFSGLEWNGACLRPERNLHRVRTPSNWQVRQPIYNSSVAKWRQYEPWLGVFSRLEGLEVSAEI